MKQKLLVSSILLGLAVVLPMGSVYAQNTDQTDQKRMLNIVHDERYSDADEVKG